MKTKSFLILMMVFSGIVLVEGAFAHGQDRPYWFSAASLKALLKKHHIPAHNWANSNNQPTLVPSPSAPQNLNELHERSLDAIAFALGRNHALPTFQFTAGNQASANNARAFPAPGIFALPAVLPVTYGRATDSALRLRLGIANGKDITCFYRAKGQAYEFDFCAPASYEAICLTSLNACKAVANLGVNAGETVVAQSAALQMNSCGNRCLTPTMQVNVGLKNFNDACGGLALSSVHLFDDLHCANPGHLGLQISGDGLKLNGHGNSVDMPGATIGIFVRGHQTSVRNVSASNIGGGYGLLAYNTNALALYNNRFRSNLVGVSIYTDERDTTGIEVVDNDLSANAFSGLILKGDGKQTDEPLITGNNFANCGGYAIAADAKNATFSRKQKNYFKGVRSALYLANGNFVVKGLDLSGSGATAPQIFVESAKSLTVSKVNLSYSAPATSSQERVALHLYRVGEVSISGLVVNGADVGLKVATEQGTNTSLKMAGSSINHSVMAAVMLQSYDDTALGLVRIQGNDFSNNPAGYAVWQVGTTALGAGSFVGGNTQ